MQYKYFILLLMLCHSILQSQTPYPTLIIDGSQPWHNGPINISDVDKVIFYNSVSNSAKAHIEASQEIVMIPDAKVINLNNAGNFHLSLKTAAINIVSYHPNGWTNIPKFSKLELGVELPLNIQSQIDNFLNGLPGLNPYDPNQIQIECIFNGSYKRYGFYYRDYAVQNNEWIENPTNYKFRIRFAPPFVGNGQAVVNLIVNGVLIETTTRYFGVDNSSIPGHLKIASGNRRKLDFTDGTPFYALGQDIGFALPSAQSNCATSECFSPFSFQKQRDYIADLANNGGNFVRIRMDALNGLIEWPHQKILASDANVNTSIPLSKYLNNYDEQQRYLSEMDKTFSLMEGTDMYCMFNLLPDQNFAIDNAYDCGHSITWKNNPYSTITGNNVNGCKDFFTNAQSMTMYRKWLYYVMARYGYSTRLGIWEMINETSGVANSYSFFNSCNDYAMYSPYNNESAFANDVNNWTCDMKYYLEQFYPWHPTTTGNTGEEGLPYANCLNIWSTNNYTGFIQLAQNQPDHNKYTDSNFGRFAKARFFENNNRPFIFGELGLGDGMNFVDKFNDREFHNTLWSTSMMGGIGSGLYWNDWEQSGGVNHRANFKAIKSFFTNYTDLAQSMSAQIAEDRGVAGSYLRPRKIHTYSMVRWDKKYVIGWAQNNSSNWTVDYQSIPITYDQWGNLKSSPSLALSESQFDGNIEQYACFSTNQNPYIKVDNLKADRRYRVQIYDTYNNSNLLETKFVYTTPSGALIFRRFMPNIGNSPFYPDYAFIANYDPVFRLKNPSFNQETDTLDITDADTLCLVPDFIDDNISDYTYLWNLGNGVTSKDSMPCSHYSKVGIYNIEVTATNTKNDSMVRFSKKLVVIKKYLYRNDNVIASPNPAFNKIYLSFDKTAFINPKIKLIDVLGREDELLLNADNSLNIESFETGVYFIKFTTNDYEQIIKISIQH